MCALDRPIHSCTKFNGNFIASKVSEIVYQNPVEKIELFGDREGETSCEIIFLSESGIFMEKIAKLT